MELLSSSLGPVLYIETLEDDTLELWSDSILEEPVTLDQLITMRDNLTKFINLEKYQAQLELHWQDIELCRDIDITLDNQEYRREVICIIAPNASMRDSLSSRISLGRRVGFITDYLRPYFTFNDEEDDNDY